MAEWIECANQLPELEDNSVLVYFSHGGIDMVHIEDYFKDITNGFDDAGQQLYTKRYLCSGVTHWMHLPAPPASANR